MLKKMYLHSSKESNLEEGAEWGLTGDALKEFRYALYEVEFDVDVNVKTGEVIILKVNGRELK